MKDVDRVLHQYAMSLLKIFDAGSSGYALEHIRDIAAKKMSLHVS